MSTTAETTPTTQTPPLRPGQPIPTPPDFPVRWAAPDQARLLWTLDKQHFPDPVSPLTASIQGPAMADAFNKTAEQYALPLRMDVLYLNTYLYYAISPVGMPPAFLLKGLNALKRIAPGMVNALLDRRAGRMAQRYLAHLNPVMERLAEYWENDWLPEVQRYLTAWESFDLDGAGLPRLLAHLEESVGWIRRVWEIHGRLMFPAYLAISRFEELYGEHFNEAEPLAAFRLLQGLDNSFLASDRALWQLSRQALTLPEVRRILEMHEAARVIPALEGSPAGRIFLAELRAFLDQYGRRANKTFGMDEVSWLEDPAPVIKSLQAYLTQPDRDLEAECQAQAVEREQGVARARRRLQGHPLPAANRFETWLKAAQAGAFLSAEHDYWLDQQAQYQLRRVVQAVGCRLATAGVIGKADDVFYLTLDEVRETVAALPRLDRKALLRERQAEMAHFWAAPGEPPLLLGAVPLMEPPKSDPLKRAFDKMLGAPLTPAMAGGVSQRETVLAGVAASPGVARGRARVIRNLAGAGNLQQGDVLVAEAIQPPWTPLFATAAAVVTEVGGILSHSAIMAREYGIPAVVGVSNATTLLVNGQAVEVDGSAGVVRLLSINAD